MAHIQFKIALAVLFPVTGWFIVGSDLIGPDSSQRDQTMSSVPEWSCLAPAASRESLASMPTNGERFSLFNIDRQIVPASVELQFQRNSTGIGSKDADHLRLVVPPRNHVRIVSDSPARGLDAMAARSAPIAEDDVVPTDECRTSLDFAERGEAETLATASLPSVLVASNGTGTKSQEVFVDTFAAETDDSESQGVQRPHDTEMTEPSKVISPAIVRMLPTMTSEPSAMINSNSQASNPMNVVFNPFARKAVASEAPASSEVNPLEASERLSSNLGELPRTKNSELIDTILQQVTDTSADTTVAMPDADGDAVPETYPSSVATVALSPEINLETMRIESDHSTDTITPNSATIAPTFSGYGEFAAREIEPRTSTEFNMDAAEPVTENQLNGNDNYLPEATAATLGNEFPGNEFPGNNDEPQGFSTATTSTTTPFQATEGHSNALTWERTELPRPSDQHLSHGTSAGETPDRPSGISPTAHRNAARAVDLGISLAERRAHYSARAHFIQALRTVAQSLDENQGGMKHTEALTQGLLAIQEAVDFIPSFDIAEDVINLQLLIGSHRTELLKDADVSRLAPWKCLQEYLAYGEARLVESVADQPVASAAIYGLGRLQIAFQEDRPEPTATRELKAMAMYQAALVVDSRNHLAANELGVLLARNGKYNDAVRALQLSVQVYPQATTWRNLAAVHQKAGQPERATLAMREATAMEQQSSAVPTPTEGTAEGIQWVTPEQFNQIGDETAKFAMRPSTETPTHEVPVGNKAMNSSTPNRSRKFSFGTR